jgi:hypothetical protein
MRDNGAVTVCCVVNLFVFVQTLFGAQMRCTMYVCEHTMDVMRSCETLKMVDALAKILVRTPASCKGLCREVVIVDLWNELQTCQRPSVSR